MLTKIDGALFKALIENGIRSLEKHKREINELNVFPVPDGDTGTNMLMTLKGGFEAIRKRDGGVGELADLFANASVWGARGNSGVILSQYLRGIADALSGVECVGSEDIVTALKEGYKKAYSSVAKPVEGTMLTVMREASMAVEISKPHESLEALFEILIKEAKISLERTPDLLPILKKAGVVDSGGKGVVRFFEGVAVRLHGKEVELDVATEEAVAELDFSGIDRNTVFEYGYCFEGLLQLTVKEEDFDFDRFRRGLERCGTSVVATLIGDKVKLHVHVKKLSAVMDHCQSVGELLSMKIENMTVQNLNKENGTEREEKFLYTEEECECDFAIVAVATNPVMQRMFYDMGADVVIMSEIAPSSKDFTEAFGYTKKKKIIVYPNSSNSVLTSMQAGGLYKGASVTVLNCRSFAECYASLSVVDFSDTAEAVVECAKEVISSSVEVSVYHAIKDVKFGSKKIKKNDYFALLKNEILATDLSLSDVAIKVVRDVLMSGDFGVITLFHSEALGEEFVVSLVEKIDSLGYPVDVAVVPIGKVAGYLTLTFE